MALNHGFAIDLECFQFDDGVLRTSVFYSVPMKLVVPSVKLGCTGLVAWPPRNEQILLLCMYIHKFDSGATRGKAYLINGHVNVKKRFPESA